MKTCTNAPNIQHAPRIELISLLLSFISTVQHGLNKSKPRNLEAELKPSSFAICSFSYLGHKSNRIAITKNAIRQLSA